MKEIERKLLELKSVIGKFDEESRKRFKELTDELAADNNPETKELLKQFIDDGLDEIRSEIATLRSQIENEYEILPLAYIAKEYFNKSKAWLYQRLNGYRVKGRVYTLNAEQKAVFNHALQDIARRIGSLQLS